MVMNGHEIYLKHSALRGLRYSWLMEGWVPIMSWVYPKSLGKDVVPYLSFWNLGGGFSLMTRPMNATAGINHA